jgi:RNA polymerase sporulation-specific sigma factor
MDHLELEACILKAKSGDKTEMGKILEQYKPFIYKTAKSYNVKNHDINDLVQIGYITLMNAVSKYKLESHTFSTYAYNSIKNSLNYVARQNKKYINDFSLNTPISSESNGCQEFIDCLESEENIEASLMKTESIKELRTSLSKLSKEERELILKLF